MTQFSKDHQPAKAGRKLGSRNKRSQFSDRMTADAIKKLDEALEQSEQWAIECVLKRTHPSLKPVTPTESLDGDYLRAKIFEISELQARIEALEALPNV